MKFLPIHFRYGQLLQSMSLASPTWCIMLTSNHTALALQPWIATMCFGLKTEKACATMLLVLATISNDGRLHLQTKSFSFDSTSCITARCRSFGL